MIKVKILWGQDEPEYFLIGLGEKTPTSILGERVITLTVILFRNDGKPSFFCPELQ
jgi:hypothetical protein